MKFRFALLVAALALALSISAFSYSEEPAQDTAAPAQEETTSDDSTPRLCCFASTRASLPT